MIRLTHPEIANDLADRIRAGEYRPGEQLAFDELAEAYQVSRDTIKRAVALLRDRGLARYAPGRGNFVVDQHPIG